MEQKDNDPNPAAKATQEFLGTKKWDILRWPSQKPDIQPIERAFGETVNVCVLSYMTCFPCLSKINFSQVRQ